MMLIQPSHKVFVTFAIGKPSGGQFKLSVSMLTTVTIQEPLVRGTPATDALAQQRFHDIGTGYVCPFSMKSLFPLRRLFVVLKRC